ncbi:MAG TPA: hypothetical protein VFY30_00365, partial [Solirubrobacterales bacterium]|nr:hypothetical protein [Solirubrobacterales bacterium]
TAMTATPNKMRAISASTERRSMRLAVGDRVQLHEALGTIEKIVRTGRPPRFSGTPTLAVRFPFPG